MLLTKEQRTILFGTPLLSRQVRKCVQSKGAASADEIREIFHDVGSNLYNQTLRQLQRQGVLVRAGGKIVYCTDAPTLLGCQADRVWKAARLLQSFGLDELCKTADVKWTYAQKLLSRWSRSGFVVKIADSCRGFPGIWRITPSAPIARPVQRRKQ